MARKRTGTVQEFRDAEGRRFYRARLRLADGSRPYLDVPEAFRFDEAKAKRWAEAMQEREGARGEILAARTGHAPVSERASDWFDRYFTWRSERGFVTAGDTKARLLRYALPHFAGKRMAEITRDHVEAIVGDLDAAILERRRYYEATDERGGDDDEGRKPGLSASTARNAWGDVGRAFDEACNSKDRSLRVLTVDPTAGVRGPERGDSREKPFLYPGELSDLLACERVPLHWRRMYAVAAYTGARANELAALLVEDVDLVHQKIHITKQVDRETGKLRPTKTRRVRSVDVEPALVPLLEVLVEEAGEGGRLLRMPPDEDRACMLRRHLRVAGCTREALSADDELRAPMKFHGLRDTCLSHMAVRGDDPLRIQWRAGHTSFAMTEKYISAAQKVAVGFGEPLPALPASLLEWSTDWSKEASDLTPDTGKQAAIPTGIEGKHAGRTIPRESGRIVDVAARGRRRTAAKPGGVRGALAGPRRAERRTHARRVGGAHGGRGDRRQDHRRRRHRPADRGAQGRPGAAPRDRVSDPPRPTIRPARTFSCAGSRCAPCAR